MRRVNVALMNEPDPAFRAYFGLLPLLGMRKHELLAARWADIDLSAGVLRVSVTKTGKKNLLPLPAAAASILRELPSYGTTSQWLFPSRSKSGHIEDPRKAWMRICSAAKVESCTIHDLRRTLGSWLATSGHSLPLIGRVLGHSSQASTQIYARLSLDSVRAALEANARLMLQPPDAEAAPTENGETHRP
jgi:integrase